MLLLRSLRLLRWLEAAGKLRSFPLDVLDLQLQRRLLQLHLAYLQPHLAEEHAEIALFPEGRLYFGRFSGEKGRSGQNEGRSRTAR